jgi:hypothetical protein
VLRKPAILIIIPTLFATLLLGCGRDHPAAKDAVAKDSREADDRQGLQKLDPADRKLAELQKVCPVSGSALGSMGIPYKMTVKGRVIFLCCPGCEEEVEKNPDGILKKVDALTAKK